METTMPCTHEALVALFDTMVLETTIGKRDQETPKTFQAKALDMDVKSIEKAMRYGFQRWLNDRVGGNDTTYEDKVKDTELFMATVLDGTWTQRARANAAPKADDFTTFARKHVLGLLSKEKRKELAATADKGAAYLDAVFAKNEAKLRPIVEKELAEAIRAANEKAELAKGLDLDI